MKSASEIQDVSEF